MTFEYYFLVAFVWLAIIAVITFRVRAGLRKEGSLVLSAWKLIRAHAKKLVFAAIIFWIGYYAYSFNTLRFKEEIQLSSGEVIIVKRKIVTSPLGEVGGPGGWDAKYNSFEIVSPDHPDNPRLWESNDGLLHILFDRDPNTKEWIMVTTFFMCHAWEKIGKPKYPYAEFRLQDGKWQRVPLSSQLLGREANVFLGMSSNGQWWTVELVTKRADRDDPMTGKEYKKLMTDWTGC